MNRSAQGPQIITTESSEELVILSRRAYDALLARLGDEEAEDRMTRNIVVEARRRCAEGDDAVLPAWLAEAVARGVSPIEAARIKTGLTQMQLAEKAGIDQVYLSELEQGRKRASDDVLTRIAQATGLDPQVFRED